MDALLKLYQDKCGDYSCKPVQALVDDLTAAHASGEGLQSLELSGRSKRLFNNRIQYMQVFAICEAFYQAESLSFVDLSYNNLNDLAAQAIGRLLKYNKNIVYLNLSGNDLTAAGVGHLEEVLSSSDCTLQALNLSGNQLGDEGAILMGKILRANTSLRELDVCNTGIGISGLIGICSALEESQSSQLEFLDLGRPLFKGGPQDTTTLAVSRMLASENCRLQRLGLAKHGLVDSNLETMVQYGLLRNGGLLSALDLSANRLSPFAGPTLEVLLNEARHLTSLDLASNQLGDDGAVSIARCLPYATWMRDLDLRSNNIGEQGLVALAEALPLSSHLTSLTLWGNTFGPASSKAFLEVLPSASGGGLAIDIRPYETPQGGGEGGRAQVAHKEMVKA